MPRNHFYCIYPISIKKKAKTLIRKGYSLRAVKDKLNLDCSKTSIGRWKYQSFDSNSLKKRAERKVYYYISSFFHFFLCPNLSLNCVYLFIFYQIHSLLSPNEEKRFAGWIVYRNLRRKNTTTNDLEEFLRIKFGLYPSKSWYSKFCKRNHLSYRITAVAKWSEKSKSKWKEGLDYIKRIRNDINILKLPLNRIACFDKTKFRLFSVGVKHVGIRGGYVSYFSHMVAFLLIILEDSLEGSVAKT